MVSAIIVAAGTGSRMGGAQSIPKQFLCVGGVPILGHTLRKFDRAAAIDQIVLVARNTDRPLCGDIIKECGIKKIAAIVEGGKERQNSVFHGLQYADPQTEIVLIHDAVRMFVTETIIIEAIQAAREYGASVVAVPVKDTIKHVAIQPKELQALNTQSARNDIFVVKTFDRNILWQTQTPQTFQYPLIVSFHEKSVKTGMLGTDDAMLAEYFGCPIKVVQGSYRNIKITTPDDLLIAEAFLKNEK